MLLITLLHQSTTAHGLKHETDGTLVSHNTDTDCMSFSDTDTPSPASSATVGRPGGGPTHCPRLSHRLCLGDFIAAFRVMQCFQ
jgi:hypothetical protein